MPHKVSKYNCILSSFEKADITKEYIGWLNDPIVTRYSNQSYTNPNLKLCNDYLDHFKNSDNLFLKILTTDSKAFIGTITAHVEKHHGLADIGILIGDRDYWGKGYGFSAWCQMKDHLLESLKFRKVTGGTVTKNIPMINIMKKSGMRLEATRANHLVYDGKIHDVVYYCQFR